MMHREDGITLVELLAALALSGLLVILVSTVLTTSLFAFGRVNHETQLRNKAITLSSTLQAKLKNAVAVSSSGSGSGGSFTQFQADVVTDALSEATQTIRIQLNGGQLLLDGVRFSDETLDLTGTTFSKGSNDLLLNLRVALKNEPKVEPIYLFVSIKLVS
ncbi:MAG: prepilin-type N-terminal cleavage/methylation domain-containing protein [Paenibacillaceae bacterium]|uniref:Prepilin-type N-terminal cleavage/methylation domain-containing protein n=1 Tax=Paenibacillus mellifer TaxID=2937794 RepID=A0A9X2BSZ2_9BACL|nr:prepilin-type N-terminal cleavage/methylation domain-containing protein [Paenibacillus mellifer]MBW4839436.1 prepilin-type N-terminal cleavage/methylation domain-containing protein [Paenibacillaceae bacterium]MCK8487341.1 prepilin-type N-terminal cleavage/methylation domain-containing protein [Paenibacillus mellifer]